MTSAFWPDDIFDRFMTEMFLIGSQLPPIKRRRISLFSGRFSQIRQTALDMIPAAPFLLLEQIAAEALSYHCLRGDSLVSISLGAERRAPVLFSD